MLSPYWIIAQAWFIYKHKHVLELDFLEYVRRRNGCNNVIDESLWARQIEEVYRGQSWQFTFWARPNFNLAYLSIIPGHLVVQGRVEYVSFPRHMLRAASAHYGRTKVIRLGKSECKFYVCENMLAMLER